MSSYELVDLFENVGEIRITRDAKYSAMLILKRLWS